MSMRIWHQSFTVLGDLPSYAEANRTRLARKLRYGNGVMLLGQTDRSQGSQEPVAHVVEFHGVDRLKF